MRRALALGPFGVRRLTLLSAFLLAGCTPPLPNAPSAEADPLAAGGARPTAAYDQSGVERIHIEEATEAVLGPLANAPMPAYRTAAEVALAGAADQSDDYRNAYPHYFANTIPPAAGAYRPYGEWETIEAVWTTYSNGMQSTPAVRRMFAEQTIAFVRHSKPTVDAYVVVNSGSIGNDFVKAVDSYGMTSAEKQHLKIVTLPNQTIWLMDYSGFPLIHEQTGALAFADWVYYQPRHLDDALGVRIPHEYYGATVYKTPFAFEGGNIQADGVGRCATTNRALANTGYSAFKVRNLLAAYAGCDKTYIVKDITDDGTGHIDMFFKWVDTHTVLFGEYGDTITADVDGDGQTETVPLPGKVAKDYAQTFATNKQRMDDNAALFAADTAADGQKFVVKRLPMMTRFKDDYGDLPRTFINSTFTNGVNVYPSYATSSCQNPGGSLCKIDADCNSGQHCAAGRCTAGAAAAGCDEIVGCGGGLVCKKDGLKVALTQQAQAAWEAAMPSWKHVGLRADTIALWSGAIHCITRTIPVAKKAKMVDDGLCIGGSCSCVNGGATQACKGSETCFGPTWRCACNICKGTCPGGKGCTDDADCSTDGVQVVVGSCSFDSKQGCYGASGGGGSSSGCGDVSFEGACSGNKLSYCDGGLKTSTCQGCCGWDAQSQYYNCLSGSACTACIPECTVGQSGCSSQGTHRWVCNNVGGCPTRIWSACSAGCDSGTAQCKGGGGSGGPSSCPGQDAGSTDVGGGDTSGTDAGTTDTAQPDTAQPDTTQPDTAQPDTTQPDTAQPDTTCTPQCAGKQCGPNGCGGVCGSCPFGLVCTASGSCGGAGGDAGSTDAGSDGGSCVPVCAGKVCGGDGCGGICGTCAAGSVCTAAGTCSTDADAAASTDSGGGATGSDGTATGTDAAAGSDGTGGPNLQGDATLGDAQTQWNPPPREAPMCSSAGPIGAPRQTTTLPLFGLALASLLLLRRRRA